MSTKKTYFDIYLIIQEVFMTLMLYTWVLQTPGRYLRASLDRYIAAYIEISCTNTKYLKGLQGIGKLNLTSI